MVYVDNPSVAPVVVVGRPPPPARVVFSRPPPPRPPILVSRRHAHPEAPRSPIRRAPSLPLHLERVRLNEPAASSEMRSRPIPRAADGPVFNRPLVSTNRLDRSFDLKDVVAQNRAERGTRVSRPRRQIYEEENAPLATYRRSIVKKGYTDRN